MVAVDDSIHLDTPKFRIGKFPPLSVSGFTAIMAALVTLLTVAGYGFSEKGLSAGSQVAWRFAFFVFFAALVAGPLCRLAPFGLCRYLGPQRRQLVWGFCAAFGVYLLSVLLPNLLLAPTLSHEGLTGGTTLFVAFSGALAATLAYAASPHAALMMGSRVQRTVLALASTFFWLVYAATGLARISGPHRPDLFYGVSLSLMIAALLLRFAERFVVKWTGGTASR